MCVFAVPWIIPQEFIDLYPRDLGDIPLAEHTHVPVNMPDVAWHFPYDCQGFHISFNGTCNQTLSRIYRRGYAAAVSYSDYNIGVLLDKLDALDLTASTLVAVIGDHGWHLYVAHCTLCVLLVLHYASYSRVILQRRRRHLGQNDQL